MNVRRRSVVCDRVHEQVSLELDGELSELERRMLAAHTRSCAACAGYVEGVTRFTYAMREAKLESPERPVVIVPGRAVLSRLRASRMQVGVAAAMAVAALGIGSRIALEPSSSASPLVTAAVTRFPTDTETSNEMTLLRLARDGDPRNRSAAEL
jgi:anti-sigma factor RsiW